MIKRNKVFAENRLYIISGSNTLTEMISFLSNISMDNIFLNFEKKIK